MADRNLAEEAKNDIIAGLTNNDSTRNRRMLDGVTADK